MKKIVSLLLSIVSVTSFVGSSSANANILFGLILCSALQKPFTIFCNGKAAPPINPNTCLPASWKDIATIPELFGGTPENPVTHLTCQWVSTDTGEQIASTVMDITDDHSGNFPTGKVSNIIVSDHYTYDSIPNPIPDDYTANISVMVENK
jgi:hypothetical protein